MIIVSSRRPMSDPLIRACDHYVVLEPGQPEQLLSADDTLAWLERHLRSGCIARRPQWAWLIRRRCPASFGNGL